MKPSFCLYEIIIFWYKRTIHPASLYTCSGEYMRHKMHQNRIANNWWNDLLVHFRVICVKTRVMNPQDSVIPPQIGLKRAQNSEKQ